MNTTGRLEGQNTDLEIFHRGISLEVPRRNPGEHKNLKHPFIRKTSLFMRRMAFSGEIMTCLEEHGETPCFYHVLPDIGP